MVDVRGRLCLNTVRKTTYSVIHRASVCSVMDGRNGLRGVWSDPNRFEGSKDT